MGIRQEHTETNGYQIGITYPEFVVMYLVHKGTSKEVNWCFTPNQPVQLYQGDTKVPEYLHFI